MAEAKIDFAIITAIEVERRAVCEAFQLSDKDRVFKESGVYWRKSLELNDDESYNIVVAQSHDMANVDAALLVSHVIQHWHPNAILLVGIAAGVDPEKQKLGDIVVGSDIYYYERGKLTPVGKRPEPFMYRADATLWNRIRAVPAWTPPNTLLSPDSTSANPQILYGVIASGEKVIANAIVRDEIIAGHRKIQAIEMEGYGFSAGVWQSFDPIHHLVIKAICDFGDENKGDDWHTYAASVAAGFTKHFLLDKPLDPLNISRPSNGKHERIARLEVRLADCQEKIRRIQIAIRVYERDLIGIFPSEEARRSLEYQRMLKQSDLQFLESERDEIQSSLKILQR
ncbi:hypothetical protein [Mastigocoleus sp. MO_188.B34]|uniref:5'-methylthioadenosine/S-adenosylhomocysteine nucleosidase family protein n=1 Tax=Mastigocoleus sp. MO_188.B34 TaxID=3036635 RepID=UPI00263702C7|nr:hypothetical protein [Mastigocoleus sp. MO_188.B34]MDJ0697700.1 hypothetical protein [Mastigocoleus sp. MO_188.B34]